ncbi:MAG: hypothetical protein R6U62_01385 [Bacteroidales bacterium]
MTGLDLSPQLQAGLGRPANYKKEAVVAVALGLRSGNMKPGVRRLVGYCL